MLEQGCDAWVCCYTLVVFNSYRCLSVAILLVRAWSETMSVVWLCFVSVGGWGRGTEAGGACHRGGRFI